MNKPMGVSQWREYGKKYGYWDYFEKKINPELKGLLIGIWILLIGILGQLLILNIFN